MTYVVSEPDWKETLEAAAAAYYKLIIVVGAMGSGKTQLLKEIATYNFHYFNFAEEFSRKLLTRPVNSRAAEAEQVAIDLIESQGSKRLAIDNTEVLFERPIQLHPLALLKRISLEHLVVTTWTGRFDDSKLAYGQPGHPAFQEFRYTEQDTFIIVPTEEP